MRHSARPQLETIEARALLSGLVVTLATDGGSYAPGQAVRMTLGETNASDQDAAINAGFTADDLWVTRDGVELWRASRDLDHPHLPPSLPGVLHPHQSRAFVATWNGQPDTGSAGPATGDLVVHGIVDGIEAPPVAIHVGSAASDPSGSPALGPIATPSPDGPWPTPAPADPAPTGGTDPGSSLGPIATPRPDGPFPTGPLAVSVAARRPVVRAGQDVRLTLTETNTGSTPVAVGGRKSALVSAIRPDGRVVRLAAASARGLARTLGAGQSRHFTVLLPGRLARAGALTILAVLDGVGGATTVQVLGRSPA